jgi:hypothetical protein
VGAPFSFMVTTMAMARRPSLVPQQPAPVGPIPSRSPRPTPPARPRRASS